LTGVGYASGCAGCRPRGPRRRGTAWQLRRSPAEVGNCVQPHGAARRSSGAPQAFRSSAFFRFLPLSSAFLPLSSAFVPLFGGAAEAPPATPAGVRHTRTGRPGQQTTRGYVERNKARSGQTCCASCNPETTRSRLRGGLELRFLSLFFRFLSLFFRSSRSVADLDGDLLPRRRRLNRGGSDGEDEAPLWSLEDDVQDLEGLRHPRHPGRLAEVIRPVDDAYHGH